MSFPAVGETRVDVAVLDDPAAAFARHRRRQRLAREIEVLIADDVYAILGDEQPERGPDARIGIKQLVETVPRVVAVVDVEDPPIAYGLHEADRHALDRVVAVGNPQARRAAVHWVLAELPPREAGHAFGGTVEVAVEHPDRVVAAGDVFLQHQVGAGRVLELLVLLEQLPLGAHDDHRRAGPRIEPRAVYSLEGDGEDGSREPRQHIVPRLREHRRRRGDAEPLGQVKRFPLVAEGPNELRRSLREPEPLRQRRAVGRHEQRRRVVGGDQHRLPTEPPAQVVEEGYRVGGQSSRHVPGGRAAAVARRQRGLPRIAVHGVHGDPEAAQAADDAQGSVTEAVPEQDDGHGRVNRREGPLPTPTVAGGARCGCQGPHVVHPGLEVATASVAR